MKTHTIISLFILFLCNHVAFNTRAQAASWQQAEAITQISGSQSSVTAMTTDAAGNLFLTGFFNGEIELGTTRLKSLGFFDVFVAKWSPFTHQYTWAQRAGGTANDIPQSIASSGNSVYIAGRFNSYDATFGNTQLPKTTAAYDENAFVAKLTDSGNAGTFIWAYEAGGPQRDIAFAVAASGTKVYIAGYFISSTAQFGSISLPNTTANSSDAFIAQLEDNGPNGTFTWARHAGSTGYDQAYALAVSGLSVYVAGSYAGPSASFGSTSLFNAGRADAFVAKLTDTGVFEWAQGAGGTADDEALALSINNGIAYIAGSFSSTTAAFGGSTLASAGEDDVFVAKVTDTGSASHFVWAQRAGGQLSERATALAVSGSSVYVAGYFGSSLAVFGASAVLNASAAAIPPTDIFLAKIEDAGSTSQFIWAQSAGGTDYDGASSVVIKGTTVYVCGDVAPPASFGGMVIPRSGSTFSAGFFVSVDDAQPLATKPRLASTTVAVFPNPARTLATVEMTALSTGIPVELVLLDGTGRAVYYQQIISTGSTMHHDINATNLLAGLYLLKVQTPSSAIMLRLVID